MFPYFLSVWLLSSILFTTAAAAAPIRVLLVDGYGNHDWQRTTRLTADVLKNAGGFELTVSTVPLDPAAATAAWCPTFQNYDVVIQTCNDLGGRGPMWPAPAREGLEHFVHDGGGLFILHSANNAFATWPAYNSMIGLGWRGKEVGTALRVQVDGTIERIPPGQGNGTSHGARTDRVIHQLGTHPIHAGLPAQWKTPLIEVYTYVRGPAENLTVLSWAEDPKTGERWPIEWVVNYGEGRVFNSTYGHIWHDEADPVDLRAADFQTLLVRALQWLAKRPVDETVPKDFPTAEAVSLRDFPAAEAAMAPAVAK
ncbi:MAG: ThuA domain-containing protein [Chthoniobacterales bacterium]